MIVYMYLHVFSKELEISYKTPRLNSRFSENFSDYSTYNNRVRNSCSLTCLFVRITRKSHRRISFDRKALRLYLSSAESRILLQTHMIKPVKQEYMYVQTKRSVQGH